MSSNDDRFGEVLAGRYELASLLGSGGMGVVYCARDLDAPERTVAIKLLKPFASAAVASRFEREMGIMKTLSHPNLLAVHDHGETEDGRRFFVMDHLRGETLADTLAREPLSEERWRRILLQVCAGLSAAHASGIVHRDLKPANIFICEGSSPDSIKLLDFGIAKVLEDISDTKTMEIVGTPQYMSPEQARGRKGQLAQRSDVFSLGAIAYEMISGVRPFSGESTPDIIHEILNHEPLPLTERSSCSTAVAQLVASALDKDPSQRLASADEFARRLRASLGRTRSRASDGAETVRSEPAADDHKKRVRPWLPIAGLAALVVAGALLSKRTRVPLLADIAPLNRLGSLHERGDRGVRADEESDPFSATRELVRAYAEGDRRPSVRAALHRRLLAAEALHGTAVLTTVATTVAVSSQGEFAVAANGSVQRFSRRGALLSIHEGNWSRLEYSADGAQLALSGGSTGALLSTKTGELSEQKIPGRLDWMNNTLVVFSQGNASRPAQLYTRSIEVRVPLHRRSCKTNGRASAATTWKLALLVCPQSSYVFRGVKLAHDISLTTTISDAEKAYLAGDNIVLTDDAGAPFVDPKTKTKRRAELGPTAIVIALDGRHIAIRSNDELAVHRADFARGLPTTRRFTTDADAPLEFLERGMFARGTADGVIRIYDAFGGLELFALPAHSGPITHLAAAEDFLLSVSTTEAKLWRLAKGSLPIVMVPIDSLPRDPIGRLFRAPTVAGPRSFTAVVGGMVHFFAPNQPPLAFGNSAVAVSADGTHFSVGGAVHESETGMPLYEVKGTIETIGDQGSALFVSDPERVLVRRNEKLVTVVDASEHAAALSLGPSGASYLILKREGLRGELEIRASKTGKLLAQKQTRASHAFFIDDEHVVLGLDRSARKIWGWSRNTVIDLEGRNPNRRRSREGISSYRIDSTDHFFELATGRVIGIGPQGCTAQSPGRRLIALDCDGSSVIWDLPSRSPLIRVKAVGNHPVQARLAAGGRRALVTGVFGIAWVDLTLETRPVEKVRELAAKLVPSTAK